MTEQQTSRFSQQRTRYIPIAAIVWLGVALLLFLVDGFEFSLHEQQTRPRIVLEEAESDAENTLVLNATGQFQYGDFSASMLPDGEDEETYASRDDAADGSELAQAIFSSNNDITALSMSQEQITLSEETIEEVFEEETELTEDETVEQVTVTQGTLRLTLEDGADRAEVIDDVSEVMNTYFPRTDLTPNLWLLEIEGNPDTVLTIQPVDTGIWLLWFVLAFAGVEAVLGYLLHDSDDKLIRPLVRVVGVFVVVWSFFGHMPLWDYILNIIFPTSSQYFHPSSTVVGFAAQHIELVVVSSLITIPLGLIIGILVTREEYRDFLPLANSIVNSGQTIPTLAVVAIMAPIIGFGFWPAVIALIIYGLLPVVRNTITGLAGVDPFIIDSAKGMGMTNTQILFQIEIPVASRIIMAGIRTSMVVNVGTATLGAFVGSGGLGVPITSGLSTTTYALVMLGALPAALLAILIDYILGRVEFVLTPKGLQIEG